MISDDELKRLRENLDAGAEDICAFDAVELLDEVARLRAKLAKAREAIIAMARADTVIELITLAQQILKKIDE